MRMGSSSLSSESWVPRVGWLLFSPAASPVGSDLLQSPDVSSVASGSIISAAAEAIGPPSNDLLAEVETEELLTALEQEASHGASATEAGSHRCPEDSEGAEGKRKNSSITFPHASKPRIRLEATLLWGCALPALCAPCLACFGKATAQRTGRITAPVERDAAVSVRACKHAS